MKANNVAFDCGCIFSIISSLFVLITFVWKRERRRHPAILIASRSLCDLGLAFVWLVTSISSPLHCNTFKGRLSAFLTEFFVISSETLFACLCVDVLIHSGDPFADYRKNIKAYWSIATIIALSYSFSLISSEDNYGPSFLPICWTKYEGGRVISDTNFPLAMFFYIPWSVIFLLSIYALGRASVFLGGRKNDSSRASALRDTRRVILAHATYWGICLIFFAPETNSNDERPVLKHIVAFLSGARAIENAMVWFPKLSSSSSRRRREKNISHGEIDLSPVLNTEMQRDLLVASVEGMTNLLRDDLLNESIVELGQKPRQEREDDEEVRLESPLLSSSESDEEEEKEKVANSNMERLYVVASVAPFLIACASSGITAIVDRKEPSYVSMVFLFGFVAVALVLLISWKLASLELFARNRAIIRIKNNESFQVLRDIWKITNSSIDLSLSESLVKNARFFISPGRSGAFMFFTPDNRFVIKTISHAEEDFLVNKILPELINYSKKNMGFICLSRVFALFSFHCFGRRMPLIIMENVTGNFGSSDTKYDLKGSWIARSAEQPKVNSLYICQICGRPFIYASTSSFCLLNQDGHIPRRLLKDNDFREKIFGNPQRIIKIKTQMKLDIEFLCNLGIMDYSLLLCVRRKVTKISHSLTDDFFPSQRLLLAALVEGPSAFQFGIVDWFTPYSKQKKLENFVKTKLLCKWERDINGFQGISSVNPQEYCERFSKRVIDVVFPLLLNVVQLIDTLTGTEADEGTTLDVSGVDSYISLCELVSQTSGKVLENDDHIICMHDDLENTPFTFVVNEEQFPLFKSKVTEVELCVLMIVRDGKSNKQRKNILNRFSTSNNQENSTLEL